MIILLYCKTKLNCCWLSVVVVARSGVLVLSVLAALQLLFPMGVAALVLILAVAALSVILAQLGLVFVFVLILGVLEFAKIALFAFILEEVSTNSFSLEFEEFLHIGFAADIEGEFAGRVLEDAVEG